MPAIARGQTSDCTNPIIDLYTRFGSIPTNVYELSFQIFEKVSYPDNPLQVYPVSGRQTVDVSQDCPTGDRVETGHYVARWTVPDSEPLGTHEVRWFFKQSVSALEQNFVEEFEVTNILAGGVAQEYATVQQLRDEGVSSSVISDSALRRKIAVMSALIDKWTGRWFYPRAMTMLIDGTGKDMLLVGPPIISVSQIRLLDQGLIVLTSMTEIVDLTQVRVYNRHISQGLLDPDDRNNPKIQWLSYTSTRERYSSIVPAGHWPKGVQNIEVTGVFGYTDPDGSANGKTPDMINWACMAMVIRDLAKLGDTDARDEQAMRGRVTSIRTRDQSITYSALNQKLAGTPWTNDPTIDAVIASYRRPPTLGAV